MTPDHEQIGHMAAGNAQMAVDAMLSKSPAYEDPIAAFARNVTDTLRDMGIDTRENLPALARYYHDVAKLLDSECARRGLT